MKLHTSTARILNILEFLSTKEYATIEDVVSHSKIPYTTIYRILQTCVRLGYVDFTENHKYKLTLKIFQFASTHLYHSAPISQFAHPFLKRLSYKYGETVHLGIVSENKILYVDKIDSRYKLRMNSHIGYQADMHCTALGKVILAHLDETEQKYIIDSLILTKYTNNTITTKTKLYEELVKIKKQGYAEDNEENEKFLYCLGAPVFDSHNQVVAALSISMPTFRFDSKNKSKIVKSLFESTIELSKMLNNQEYVISFKY